MWSIVDRGSEWLASSSPDPLTDSAGWPRGAWSRTAIASSCTRATRKRKRLIYLSLGLHRRGDPSLKDLTWSERKWNGSSAYADSKLHDVILSFAVARKWPDVLSNALEPGWVATKMGGPGAPDDLDAGAETQVWLATSNDSEAMVSGKYFYHKKQLAAEAAARDEKIQERLVAECARISGVPFAD